MAAALLQYQACLGIMVRLQVEDLTALKGDFERAGERGLSLREFVSVMLDRVTAWDEDSAVVFIQDLVELFAQVDVNGDGTMEWEEFTSAIIEGGMGTMSDEMDWRDMQYEENGAFADVLNRPPKRVQYLPEFKRLLVHDNTRPVVEIVDPMALTLPTNESGDDGGRGDNTDVGSTEGVGGGTTGTTTPPSVAIVNKFHPLCYIAGYRRDQDDVRSERSPVQALKYLSRVDLLAVSGGDLKLTFWSSSILTASSASALETPIPLAIVHTPRPQRVLEWNPVPQHLYSISADLVISVWHVIREKLHDSKGKCEVSLFVTLKQHTDLLQDLLLLNSEVLVSCGMDNMIYLWDTSTLQVRATRQGHRRGVRLLTKLSNQLFLSTGFECEVLGWDISALATTPVFKLWGHNAPVCCIQLIQSTMLTTQTERRGSSMATTGFEDIEPSGSSPNAAATMLLADQAITADDDGWFKWWNLTNITSMENNDLEQSSSRCLQTFRLGSDKYPWKAHSLAVLNSGQAILAAGLHKLKLLHRVRLKPKILPSSVVLYNSVSFTLLTTTDREIRIWDATSGALLRTYRNISSSDISCVDLDARQRKIVFGTQRGELIVLNYMNGAILKTWTPHQLNVSALIYCKEDQCVLTASWDRSLRLYDDNAGANSLLRCVTDAHDADIKCMAYCYAMSLVATGSTDGTIKVWDYIYFLLEDTCSLQSHGLPQSDVTALEFVDPYPLMVSCHENGLACCWNVSPSQTSVLLFCFAPFLRNPMASPSTSVSSPPPPVFVPDEENRGGVCCCQVFYDESGGEILANDIRKGRFLLISASIDGEICVDDLSQLISSSGLKAFRAESLPSNHFGSYNPRRRFIRHGKNAKRLKNHLKSRQGSAQGDRELTRGEDGYRMAAINESDIIQVAKWKAHTGVVRFLRVVEDPQSILTCSTDKSVRVWSLDGSSVGTLVGTQVQGRNEPQSTTATSSWSWQIDTSMSAQTKREQAEEIWDSIKGDKLKLLARRRQSMKSLVRQQRRSTLGLKQAATSVNQHAKSRMPIVSDNQESSLQEEVTAMPEDTQRLFKQLKGEATWKQSDFQLARQVAWEKERAKFHQRMKRILKKKNTKKFSDESGPERDEDDNTNDGDDTHSLLMETTLAGDDTALSSAATLLPSELNSSVQELPFDDKDNWSVGGLNRQKQMYGNLHHENVRRNQKLQVAAGSKLRRMQSMSSIDLTPSSFLLEQLGSCCIIKEHQQSEHLLPVRNAKKKAGKTPGRRRLEHSQSVDTLSLGHSTSTLLSSGSEASLSGVSLSSAAQPTVGQGEAENTQTLHAVQSAPTVTAQATLKDLFLQQKAVEDKAHRASQILTRSGTFHPQSSLPVLTEHDADSKALESERNDAAKKKKSISAPRRKASAETLSISGKPRPTHSKTSEVTAKKQRIRSDTNLLRQNYFGTYSRDDVVNVYRTFNSIDKDGSGTITLRELVDGAGLFGSTHLRENVMGIFSSIDKDQSGHIDLKELSSAIFSDAPVEVLQDIVRFYTVLESAEKARRSKKKQLTTEQLGELKQLFQLYDADRNGDIDVDELFNALRYNERFYDGDGDGDDAWRRSSGDGRRESSDGRRESSVHITREDVQRIIARFDKNTNSTLDLPEFIELFREEL